MIQLGKSRVSGAFALSAEPNAPTKLVIVPENAGLPAEITALNTDGAAVVYLKWREIGSGGGPTTTDFGILLRPGDSYTWHNPPRESELVGISTVANSLVCVDGNWTDVEFVS